MGKRSKTKDTESSLNSATPVFWLESTLSSYEVKEIDGHELAQLIPLAAIADIAQTALDPNSSDTT